MIREVHEISNLADWLALRQRDVTASRVAALFCDTDGKSVHPFMTRDQIAASMRGESLGSNAAMRRGRILEPAVAAAMAEERPDLPLRKATTYHRLPEHRIGATPDYFADTAAGVVNVQCKTVNPDTWEKWKGRPPLGYQLQVVCENLVTDAVAGMLAVMVTSPSYPLHLFDIPRHEAAEGRILDAAAEFWRAWDAGEIAAPALADDLAAMLDDGSVVDLSKDNAIRGLLDEHLRLSAAAGAIKKELGAVDHKIKTRIGKARTAFVPGYQVTFTTQKRKEYVTPAAEYRALRIKAISEEVE